MDPITPVVVLDQVSVCYGPRTVLDAVSLSLPADAFVAVIGPNGGGKTTLVRAMLGLVPVQAGRVRLFGVDPRLSRHFVGYVPQTRAFDTSFPISVREVVAMGCLAHRHPKAKQAEHVEMALSRLDLIELAERPIGRLSGGELQRTLMARAVASEPKMLILDEPTSNMDPLAIDIIYGLLRELNQSIPVITVSHDIGAVSQFVKTIACVNRCLHYHDSNEVTAHILQEAYGCPVDLVGHGAIPHRVLSKHTGHAHD